jgi:hypothetical protein
VNCQEISGLLVAYADGEVSPSERKLVQAHLDACARCRQELSALSLAQDRVRRSLHRQAAQAVPAPDAWARLQRRLAAPTHRRRAAQAAPWFRAVLRPMRSLFLGGTLLRRFAVVALLALILLLGFVTIVPSVRAQVRDMITAWFHFQLPGGRSSVGIGWGESRQAFPPYLPTWLPEGLDLGLIGGTTVPGAEYVEFEFHPMPRRKGDERFIRLIEGQGEAVPGLPEGRATTVGDRPAVFSTDLEERHQIQTDPPTPAGARLLAWYIGETKIELVSNLSETDMVRVAASLVQMEGGAGESR